MPHKVALRILADFDIVPLFVTFRRRAYGKLLSVRREFEWSMRLARTSLWNVTAGCIWNELASILRMRGRIVHQFDRSPCQEFLAKSRTTFMEGQDKRLILERYLTGILDSEQEYALRHEDVVIDMPQSGERIRGRDNMKAMQDAYPGPPTITIRRMVGSGDIWVVEGRFDYSGRIYFVTNIIEFSEGKIIRETRYYADPFEAPTWRAQWVEPIESENKTSERDPGQESSNT